MWTEFANPDLKQNEVAWQWLGALWGFLKEWAAIDGLAPRIDLAFEDFMKIHAGEEF